MVDKPVLGLCSCVEWLRGEGIIEEAGLEACCGEISQEEAGNWVEVGIARGKMSKGSSPGSCMLPFEEVWVVD